MCDRFRALLNLMLWLIAGPAGACGIQTTGLAFGVIDPLAGQATTARATVTVDCPDGGAYTLTVSAGHGDDEARYLWSGDRRLYYNLYADPAYTRVVGDGSGVGEVLSGDGGGTHTLYGLLPPQPDTVPGHYADNLVVTVHY